MDGVVVCVETQPPTVNSVDCDPDSTPPMLDIQYSPLRQRSPSKSAMEQYQHCPRQRSVSIAARPDGHASDNKMRWLVLFLSCWIMFGNYYAYDNPSALITLLREWMGDPSGYQMRVSLLYSIYSFPNIILPLFAGRFIDKYGTGRMLVVLSGLVCVGQAVFAKGVSARSWWLMLLGRFVFGLGGESLSVAQARLVTRWFEGKELALAIGLNLSVARLGTVFNNNLSPWFAMKWSVPTAMWIGLVSCLVSFGCTCWCVLLDRRHSCKFTYQDILITDPIVEQHRFMPTAFKAHRCFWLLTAVCFLNYGGMIPYNNIASEYLQIRYFPSDIAKANAWMSLPDTLAIALVPVFGVFVDVTSRKLDVILIGCLSFMFGHYLLCHSMSPIPLIPLTMLGVGYSSMLAFWPCVPNLVHIGGQALAYGILTGAFNAAVSLVPLVVPFVIGLDEKTYIYCGWFFTTLALFSTLITITIQVVDRHCKLGMNSKAAVIHHEPVMVVLSGAGPLPLDTITSHHHHEDDD